ncbi:MAG: GGDEF domain-containing protein [Planctomycetota bacterium]|nr:GGDEF domain-containing protein [Planctomycetota bacterium]
MTRISPLRLAEAAAPYLAGLLLLACGGVSLAHALGFGNVPQGPLGAVPLPVSVLVTGAGLGILLASFECARLRRATREAQAKAARAEAERDLALRQARRMRAQAEGLALMREIHRTTSIPERRDRLHRILTLVGELFEAYEVTLFAAQREGALKVQPAAYLSTRADAEVFAAFAVERLGEALEALEPSGPDVLEATMAWEGCKFFVEGKLALGETALGVAQLHRTLAAHEGRMARQKPEEILQAALAALDFGVPACRHAAKALEQGRTLRQRELAGGVRAAGEHPVMLCVPLIADQRPVGVLRIRRLAEDGFDDPAAEALEELLSESAKHIALALKKDEDDRAAITDQLTGLFIKRHFLATLEILRAEAAASGRAFALVLLDIDHFKKVNDTHGHLSGDLVLKGVARVLQDALRSGDLAFRYGGEELALLMPGASAEAAEQTAERLRAAVERAVLHGENGQPIPVTVSLGLAPHRAGLTGEELISRADRALYASKSGGATASPAGPANSPTRWPGSRKPARAPEPALTPRQSPSSAAAGPESADPAAPRRARPPRRRESG